MLDHEMTRNEIVNAIGADLTGAALEYWHDLAADEKRCHVRVVQAGLDSISGRQRTIQLQAREESL
jgi:hypothetical protein